MTATTNPVTRFSPTNQAVAAGSTPVYGAVLIDAAGNPVGLGTITVLTLSITDDATGAVVNGCGDPPANILNTGRGTLDANGNLGITLEAADTAILRQGDAKESRSLTIDFEYPGPNGTTMTGRHRAILSIEFMPGD